MTRIGSTQRKSSIAGTANLSVTKVDTGLQKPAKFARHRAVTNRMPTQSLQSKKLVCIKRLTESASNRVPDISQIY
jgi:hypothetical protein